MCGMCVCAVAVGAEETTLDDGRYGRAEQSPYTLNYGDDPNVAAAAALVLTAAAVASTAVGFAGVPNGLARPLVLTLNRSCCDVASSSAGRSSRGTMKLV